MRLFLALFVALLFPVAEAGAQGWRTYSNARFGATAEVPADWRAGREPENGDGLKFTSPDRQASITVTGSLNIEDTVEDAMKQEAEPNDGETVIYRDRQPRALVISGTRSHRIFYRKALLSCRDQIWNRVSIEYSAARKRDYDALVTRVARSLRGGKSAQVDDCE